MIRLNINKFIILLFTFVFLSCNNDDEHIRFKGTLEAKINDELVVFENGAGRGFFDLENSCCKNFHEITGSMEFKASDGHTIYLNFRPSKGVGTYNPHAQYHTWVGEYKESGVNGIFYHQENTGSVTITSTDNEKYKGTFYFTAVYNGESYHDLPNIVNITEGKFEILAETHEDYGCDACGYD